MIAILFITLTGCSTTEVGNINNQEVNTNNEDSEARKTKWIEEIDYLTTKLEDMHPAVFTNITEEEYDEKIKDLKNNIEKLTDNEIHFKLKELVASVKDAHTKYYPFNWGEKFENENIYPVELDYFEDEIRIIGVSDKKYKDILGMKLVGINDIPINEVLTKFEKILSYENDEWKKVLFLNSVTLDKYLKYLEISEGESVTLNLEDDDKKINKKISTVTVKEYDSLETISYKDTIPNRKNIVYESKPEGMDDAYWYKFIEEDNIFYFQYNECTSSSQDPNYPNFYQFSSELIESINKNIDNIDKFVVDLRNNMGGNNSLMAELCVRISKEVDMSKLKVYTIAGRETFSSGTDALANTKEFFNSTFVGSETGGNVACFAELGYIDGPNELGTILCSTKEYDLGVNGLLKGEGGAIPDVDIKDSFESYKKGIDDCYEYIKKQ